MKPLPEIHLDATVHLTLHPDQLKEIQQSHCIIKGPVSAALFIFMLRNSKQLTVRTFSE